MIKFEIGEKTNKGLIIGYNVHLDKDNKVYYYTENACFEEHQLVSTGEKEERNNKYKVLQQTPKGIVQSIMYKFGEYYYALNSAPSLPCEELFYISEDELSAIIEE
jgi:hypothetical protein